MEEQEQEAQGGYGPVTAIAMIVAGFAAAAGAIAFAGGWPHIHHSAPAAAPSLAPGAFTYQPPLIPNGPPMVHTGGFYNWIASWPPWVTVAAPIAFFLVAAIAFTWAAAHFIDTPERKHRKAPAPPAPAVAAQVQPAASNGSNIWYPQPSDTDSFSVRALERALKSGEVPSPAPR